MYCPRRQPEVRCVGHRNGDNLRTPAPTGASRLGSLNPAHEIPKPLVLTVLAACGAPSLEAHQLKVTIEDERLTIRGVGERLLLDLPIRELAARSGSASHQMKFGSFLVEDLPQQAWQVSESIDVSSDDETLTASWTVWGR